MLPAGLILGLVFSATMLAASIWCVQVTASCGLPKGTLAASGVALAQGLWAAVVAISFSFLSLSPGAVDLLVRVVAVVVLLMMGWVSRQAGPVTTLRCPCPGSARLLAYTWQRAFFMRWRFLGLAAGFVAMGLHLHHIEPHSGIILALGVTAGTMLWLMHFCIVAFLFARKVPEDICLRSLNKLRTLATGVFFALALLALLPILLRL